MMPLSYAETGEELIIKRLTGKPEMKTHLEHLGFVPGALVTVMSRVSGNLIVKIKESRLAISEETAQRIMV